MYLIYIRIERLFLYFNNRLKIMCYLISLHVGADMLSLLFLYELFIFFSCIVNMRCDKATHLSLLFKSTLSVRLRTN